MIKTSIEKLADPIGFDIGNSDDQVQADLLNGFCRAMGTSMDDNQLNMQCCYILDKLDLKYTHVLETLVEYIKDKKNE